MAFLWLACQGLVLAMPRVGPDGAVHPLAPALAGTVTQGRALAAFLQEPLSDIALLSEDGSDDMGKSQASRGGLGDQGAPDGDRHRTGSSSSHGPLNPVADGSSVLHVAQANGTSNSCLHVSLFVCLFVCCVAGGTGQRDDQYESGPSDSQTCLPSSLAAQFPCWQSSIAEFAITSGSAV